MDTNKKVVLITGAANGIGRDTATLFAQRGYALALVDRDREKGAAFASELCEAGFTAAFFAADVSVERQVEVMVAAVVGTFGHIDVAFNNAGIELENAPLEQCSADTFDRVMAVNARGVFLCMKYEIHQMLTQFEGGHIINAASAAGLIAAPNRSAYTASKHAVVGMTKAAAVEYGKQNIHINAICPGVIETDMFRRAMAGNAEAKKTMEEALPLGRAGNTAEVAETVFWLGSDGARYIQGHALPVDGGFTAT